MMRTRTRAGATLGSRVLAAIAVVLALGVTHLAEAQDDAARAQAREQFNLGVSRYEANDYQGALEAFQEAYRLAPHPTVRVNMANCYEHLGRPLEALHHFEAFLAESDGASRQQRREVEAAMQRLRQQVGELRLAVAPDGAMVTIDSAETRRAPILEPIRLVAGTHQIDVRLDGYRTQHREVQVVGGGSERISILLERGQDEPVAAASPARQPTSEPAAEGPSESTAEASATPAQEPTDSQGTSGPADEGGGFQLRLTTPVIIAGSATVAFTIAAVVSGVLAITANTSFEDAVWQLDYDPTLTQAERDQVRADGLAAADSARTAAIVTDVFIVGAIAAAGVTAFFVIVDGMGQEEQTAGLRIAPSVGSNGGGLLVAGSF